MIKSPLPRHIGVRARMYVYTSCISIPTARDFNLLFHSLGTSGEIAGANYILDTHWQSPRSTLFHWKMLKCGSKSVKDLRTRHHPGTMHSRTTARTYIEMAASPSSSLLYKCSEIIPASCDVVSEFLAVGIKWKGYNKELPYTICRMSAPRNTTSSTRDKASSPRGTQVQHTQTGTNHPITHTPD